MSAHDKQAPYFQSFMDRVPPPVTRFGGIRRSLWHLTAGITLGLGLWYLAWRWGSSLNPDAMMFSVAVAFAETMAYAGTVLFFFNIWDEGDDSAGPVPVLRADLGLDGGGAVHVNIIITTYDEDVDLVAPSIDAAQQVHVPVGMSVRVLLADDGNRPAMRGLAEARGVGYFAREDNRGYKAGNLAHVLFQTDADFFVICDADTQLLPEFLERTLGYFRDPEVAFVQVPHWFYDIPEGQSHADWIRQKLGNRARGLAPFVTPVLAPALRLLTGRDKIGGDPFLSGSDMFFDVIQRRRNRHHATFCCGAGSIHRTEAVFANALEEQGRSLLRTEKRLGRDAGRTLLPRLDMQPFRYHVSEDIFTSLQQHAKGYRSVYHPERLTRMLSPWSMDAWATQKLKYAGGTFDIMLRSDLIWRRGLPWKTRLHYMATFWSYLGVLWMPILFLAPMISLVTGLSPVDAYSVEFFMHLLPMLLFNELAMSLGCKGHDIHAGRVLSLATLNIQMRAFVQVLRGQKPHFPPTPKNPAVSGNLRYAMPALGTLAVMGGVALYGLWAMHSGSPDHTPSLVVVNLFWLGLNALAFARVATTAFWRPRLPDGRLLQLAS